jgi:hypothetical protein
MNGTSGGLPPAGSIEDVLERIEAAATELAALTSPETLTGWDAPVVGRLVEAHTRIRRLTGRLDGVRYTLLPRIEDEGSWRTGGTARAFMSWLRVREGVSARTAGKDMTMARRLATALPTTRDRLVAGTLGGDHAQVMTEVAPTSETRTDALAWLIDTRTGDTTTPERFVQSVPVDFPDLADDPDGTRTREQITQVLEDAITDGTLVTGEGLVLREAGSSNADQFRVVARRFATVTDPDTDDADDDKAAAGEYLDLAKTFGGYHVEGFLTDEHGLLVTAAISAVTGAPAAEDARTTGQRRAQGLADVARTVLDTNQASPGASIPPHHAVRHWADGGNTSIANSALLCWFHHQLVDARGITMHWTGKPAHGTGTVGMLVETGWAFTDARGHRIRLPEPIDTLPPDANDPTADPPAAEAA